MNRAYQIVTVLFLLLLVGCNNPTIYTKNDFSKVTNSHKTVAILPFSVSIDSKNQSKEFTLEMARKSEKDESYLFQQQIYSQFLKQQSKGKYTVEFQDVEYTNARLSQAGITYDNMNASTKQDISKKLGVDAVISGTIKRSKPMSSGSAIAIGVLFGAWGNTNRVDISMGLHNGNDSSLLWKYDHQASGSIGSSSEALAKDLMKGISKDFPYKKDVTSTVAQGRQE
jgi:hypothetical protein